MHSDGRSSPSGRAARKGRILLISQVYVPDAIAVGQHFHDATKELARRGHPVTVYTSNRAYNDPTIRFPARETIDGVDVIRLPLTSFGKQRMLLRIAAVGSFLLQAILRCLFTSRYDHVIVSTSPPMCIVVTLVAAMFRRFTISYWAMDLNPDQLIVFGKLKPDSLAARILETLNSMILRRADNVVALDRMMGDRLEARMPLGDRLAVIPPWPADDSTYDIPHSENRFRAAHGLGDRRIVMYSGNHGFGLPLDTLLQAALDFKNDPRIAFVFIGEGVRKREVVAWIAEHGIENALSLPYQPLADVPHSLSAADAHVVSIGENLSGIIHPCKIYGAMAVSRPILLLGPNPNYASDLVESHRIGWLVRHGDVPAMKAVLSQIAAGDRSDLVAMGGRSRQVIEQHYRQQDLVNRFCDRVEATMNRGSHAHAA